MLGKITKRTVETLKPGEWLWDHDHREVVKGFGARRQTAGVFYYLRFRLNGAQRMISLGRHGHLTPDTARALAQQKLGTVAAGIDPFEAKTKLAETFGAEAERYLDRKRSMMKPDSHTELVRHLIAYAKPLHRLRLIEINRKAIAVLLAEIETERGPVARNRSRSSLSAFFSWAIAEGLVEINPVAGTGKADEGGSRERVLTNSELAALWRALPADHFGDIVRLLILTGQRREEIGGLRWSEVDLNRGLIVLPPERTKNKRTHELPLSPQVRAILERQPQRKGRNLIFGHGAGSFAGWANCKKRLDRALGKTVAPWRIHDLRRTAATGMAELGVQPHVIEAVLNHVSGHKAGVAGIYNRARYTDAMRDALQRWADHVETLTVGPHKQPAPTGLMQRAFAVARGGKIIPDEDLANLARQLKDN